jgi:ribonuclease VapC
MTLDSSALVAILFGEFDHLELVDRILEADVVRIGAPTVTETAMVLTGRSRKPGRPAVARLLRKLDVTTVPFTAEHHDLAARAFERFGRGRHKAALNFGDCMSYAVARLARRAARRQGAAGARPAPRRPTPVHRSPAASLPG